MVPANNPLTDTVQYYTLDASYGYPHASSSTQESISTQTSPAASMSDARQSHSPLSDVRSSKATDREERSGSSNSSGSKTTTTTPHQKVAGFEFTKRKRWAELLINELSECIVFILSPAGAIWFCGYSINELLGWRDEEVVDRDFASLMNDDDRNQFYELFGDSIRNRSELLSYVRLRCKPPDYPAVPFPPNMQGAYPGYGSPSAPVAPVKHKEMLFEIKGYPHFLSDEDTEESERTSQHASLENLHFDSTPQLGAGNPFQGEPCKCFFVTAKPYPSRNSAMLNTFLELKIENERLQQKLANLRARQNALAVQGIGTAPVPQPSTSISASSTSSTYGTNNHAQGAQYDATEHGGSYGPAWSNYTSGEYGEQMRSPAPPAPAGGSQSLDPYSNVGMAYGVGTNSPGIVQSERDSDEDPRGAGDDGKRKKPKRVHTLSDQYVCVTCGRTDSPEWRKGPLGPKTLCNACGLRWAKQMRKFEKEGGDKLDVDGE